jgi:hypothetical protein
MDSAFLEHVAALRAVVGFLGEQGHYAWWPSSFFAPSSKAFLAPVFARTVFLAQCQGVRQAAAKVHDERIGVGHVYHLFRLPEDLEQAIHRILHDQEAVQRISHHVTDKSAGVGFLKEHGDLPNGAGVGPTRIAETAAIRESRAWRTAAGRYAGAFESGSQVYPYFADKISDKT